MSILLSCRHLSKTYGARPLFEGLSFGLFEGERTGLIGPNGTGKSTLLKILAGLETPDSGEVALRRGLKVKYVAQQDFFSDGASTSTVRKVLEEALHDQHLEPYELEMRIEEGLHSGGLRADQPVRALSGGWRKRLAILAQVLCRPDLLLLDEPTNHLDLEGVLWLERLLTGTSFSFVVVTHDRRFLEAVCNRIIELNKRYENGFFSSKGNYSQFIENREAYFDVQSAREDAVRNMVRREVEWLRRGAKARTTKQKARIDRAGQLMSELGSLEYRNAQDRTAAIDFSATERQTKSLLKAAGISKRMGERKLFGPIDLHLAPGDKLGLLGSNGSGKSTLLRILAGQLEPDTGTLRRADGLRVVTFDQHREQLDLRWPLRRALCENGEHVHYKGSAIHVAGWAERFLFSKSQLDVPLSRLSGGEQSRVLIARLMLRPADLLLLDEPTNDLDINALEVLETSILDFSGALVLVTHDRYLLDRVSQRVLALDGQGGAQYYADLAQWESLQVKEEEPPASKAKQAPPPPPPKEKTRGLTQKEEKELRSVEAGIRLAEKELQAAKKALEDPAIAANAGELMARQAAVTAAQAKVDGLLERWEALEARR